MALGRAILCTCWAGTGDALPGAATNGATIVAWIRVLPRVDQTSQLSSCSGEWSHFDSACTPMTPDGSTVIGSTGGEYCPHCPPQLPLWNTSVPQRFRD